VENEWTQKGPRQKVSKYLGKYIELPGAALQSPAALLRGTLITPTSLLVSELRAHGFNEKLQHPDIKVTISLKLCTVKAGKKAVVLGINGGFVCGYTLRRLIHHVPGVEVVAGYSLARAFSDAGVRVSREQFVTIYNNVYKRARS
jgi:hypothetical protein